MAQQSRKIDMTEAPFARKLLMFTLPIIASGILQLLFNAADVIVVGRFAGRTALAAVGSTGSLVNLIVELFMGLSIGANVVAARFYGAREARGVHDTVETSILVSLLGGLILGLVGIVFAPILLGWMSTPEDVIGLSSLYLRIYFIGMPMQMVYNFGSALLRAVGDTKRPLICLSIAGVLNIVLNLWFVIGFNMSVAGVALATVISELVSAVLVLRILVRENGPLHLDLAHMHISRGVLRQILQVGLPAGLQSTVFSLSNVVIQAAINSFGSVVIAACSAAGNIENFVYISMDSCYQATVTFTSQNVGARRYRNIGRVLGCGMLWVCVVGSIMSALTVGFGHQLLSVYCTDAEVITAGYQRLEIICGTYVLCGIMEIWVGSLRGMGYSVMPMIVSLLGSCAFRLVYIATIFEVYQTEWVLYACYPLSWIITLLAHAVCYGIVRRKFREEPQASALQES